MRQRRPWLPTIGSHYNYCSFCEADVAGELWPSVIGFDNTPSSNGLLLSSLRLPWEEMAARAARTLWQRRQAGSSEPFAHHKVPMTLAARLTCRSNWSKAPQMAALATSVF